MKQGLICRILHKIHINKHLKMKYVLVTGGVVSGLGKGVTASSIGVLLKACGHRVTSIKIGAFGMPILGYYISRNV